MEIILDLKKSLEENAAIYFEKAKKSRRKVIGAQDTVADAKKRLVKLEKKKPERKTIVRKKKQQWFEKFRWFYTSTGFLVVGGRDATSNEIVIKKHVDKDDLIFHTDMAGSPFFVLKTEGKEVDEQTLAEAADATATFSRAWKLGLSSQKVFYVTKDQVTKEANSGEYLSKGSFMIRGKTTYITNSVNVCIGKKDAMIMAGPCASVKAYDPEAIELKQGDRKVSDIAKKLAKQFDSTVDDIIRMLPTGNYK